MNNRVFTKRIFSVLTTIGVIGVTISASGRVRAEDRELLARSTAESVPGRSVEVQLKISDYNSGLEHAARYIAKEVGCYCPTDVFKAEDASNAKVDRREVSIRGLDPEKIAKKLIGECREKSAGEVLLGIFPRDKAEPAEKAIKRSQGGNFAILAPTVVEFGSTLKALSYIYRRGFFDIRYELSDTVVIYFDGIQLSEIDSSIYSDEWLYDSVIQALKPRSEMLVAQSESPQEGMQGGRSPRFKGASRTVVRNTKPSERDEETRN